MNFTGDCLVTFFRQGVSVFETLLILYVLYNVAVRFILLHVHVAFQSRIQIALTS